MRLSTKEEQLRLLRFIYKRKYKAYSGTLLGFIFARKPERVLLSKEAPNWTTQVVYNEGCLSSLVKG